MGLTQLGPMQVRDGSCNGLFEGDREKDLDRELEGFGDGGNGLPELATKNRVLLKDTLFDREAEGGGGREEAVTEGDRDGVDETPPDVGEDSANFVGVTVRLRDGEGSGNSVLVGDGVTVGPMIVKGKTVERGEQNPGNEKESSGLPTSPITEKVNRDMPLTVPTRVFPAIM